VRVYVCGGGRARRYTTGAVAGTLTHIVFHAVRAPRRERATQFILATTEGQLQRAKLSWSWVCIEIRSQVVRVEKLKYEKQSHHHYGLRTMRPPKQTSVADSLTQSVIAARNPPLHNIYIAAMSSTCNCLSALCQGQSDGSNATVPLLAWS